MAKLKRCGCGGGKPEIEMIESRGILSGDKGFLATATCPNCGLKIKRWALLKTWAKDSIYKAWNGLG